MKQFLVFVSIVTAATLIVSIAAMFIGTYIAIWGDNVFGSKIVVTGMITALLMACIGLLAHQYH